MKLFGNEWEKYFPENFEYRGRFIFNWFSNMILCPIKHDGIIYSCVESYYQAQKTLDIEKRKSIALMTGKEAKRYISNLYRKDWPEVKIDIMRYGLNQKWNQEPFRSQLLAYQGRIIEWNNWNDTFWGVSIHTKEGQNHLGLLLEEIRENLKRENI